MFIEVLISLLLYCHVMSHILLIMLWSAGKDCATDRMNILNLLQCGFELL